MSCVTVSMGYSLLVGFSTSDVLPESTHMHSVLLIRIPVNTIMHLLVSCTFKQVPTKNSNFNILRTAVMLLKLDSNYTDSTRVYIINVILRNLATISIYINSMACKTYLIIICFINHKYSIFIEHINLLCQII